MWFRPKKKSIFNMLTLSIIYQITKKKKKLYVQYVFFLRVGSLIGDNNVQGTVKY